ncbi:MAG TPA: hypothetical protein VMO20_07955 [Candidatus Acidoferrum sp.]|nr:hypothetical protein [Candidatus Acidoferrum sp.]
MNNEQYDPGLIIKMPSALFATLMLSLAAAFSLNNWNVRNACILSYILMLAVSGWSFALGKWRIAGFIHSALMLGIAGFCLYYWLGFLEVPLADNPAAGVIATASLVYLVVGIVAAIFGIGNGYFLLKDNP